MAQAALGRGLQARVEREHDVLAVDGRLPRDLVDAGAKEVREAARHGVAVRAGELAIEEGLDALDALHVARAAHHADQALELLDLVVLEAGILLELEEPRLVAALSQHVVERRPLHASDQVLGRALVVARELGARASPSAHADAGELRAQRVRARPRRS